MTKKHEVPTINEADATTDGLQNGDEATQRAVDSEPSVAISVASETANESFNFDQTVEELFAKIEGTMGQLEMIDEIDAFARPTGDTGPEKDKQVDRSIGSLHWLIRGMALAVHGQVHGRRFNGRTQNGTLDNYNYWADVQAKRLKEDPDGTDPMTADAFKRAKLAEVAHLEVARPIEALTKRLFHIITGETFEEDQARYNARTPKQEQKSEGLAQEAMAKLRAIAG